MYSKIITQNTQFVNIYSTIPQYLMIKAPESVIFAFGSVLFV